MLTRILERTIDPETSQPLIRDDFLIANAIQCRPPGNELSGAPYEEAALSHCRRYLEETIRSYRPKAIVALGNQALRWFTGEWGIEKLRGYIFETRFGPVVGTYHPAFIQRGNWELARVVQLDVKKALYITRHGVPKREKHYIIEPTLQDALNFRDRYKAAGCPPLSFDIETPYAKMEKDDGMEPVLEDDKSYVILRISFSWEDCTGISMVWSPPFLEIIKELLSIEADKICWHRHFDVPRCEANGAPVNGRIYDGMDLWHFAEPSLPMGLKYAATFHCPDLEAWKLKSKTEPAYYNIVDSDAARRIVNALRVNLEKEGRWRTFERHFVDLGVRLKLITKRGIAVDQSQRLLERERFGEMYQKELAAIQPLIPDSVKPRKVFKKTEEQLRKGGKWAEGRMVLERVELTKTEEVSLRRSEEKRALKLAVKAEKLRKAAEKKRLSSMLKSEKKARGKVRTSVPSTGPS